MTGTRFGSMQWHDWSCTVRVSVLDATLVESAARTVRALMSEVGLAASRFRSDSELSKANWLAGCPVPISRTLVDLVGAAVDAARETGGALDPTIGLDLIAAGYDRDIAAGPGLGAEPQPRTGRPGWQDVRLDRDAGLLTVLRGRLLDLGATAKSQTADAAARAIHLRYGTPVLVEIGGDLAVHGAPEGGWRVQVAERSGGPGQPIGVHGGGVTTSTTTIRTWTMAGRPAHHIIDPATGRPADGPWRTATVAAPNALAANVASTAAIVLGAHAESWLANRGLAARLVDQAGGVLPVGPWPAELPTHHYPVAA